MGSEMCIRDSSCIALVKIQTNVKESQKEKVKKILQKSFLEQPRPLNPIQPKKQFSPIKSLQRSQKKYLRVWSNLLQQSPFEKSLKVEQKYPYFRTDRKPKVPYGIKNFSEATMRVGLDQNCRPTKVLDKVNGVHTCTICDEMLLDKFSLQDHWYGKKHKQNMRLVQVRSYCFKSDTDFFC